MKQFTAEQIQEQFEKLPKELQNAITSSEMNDTLKAIANKHMLHIDQLGELVDMVGLVMLGLMPSKEFVKRFSAVAQVDETTAQKIATDINTEVFSQIRSSMQELEAKNESVAEAAQQQQTNQEISTLEQVGGFDIEQDKPESEEKTESLTTMADAEAVEEKADILAGIENPPSTAPAFTKPAETHTEPLIDHLLTTPTAIPEHKSSNIPAEPAPKPAAPVKPARSGPDPYREAP